MTEDVQEDISKRILLIRGRRVMMDTDLAVLYGTTTKKLLQQVKRNVKRFPEDFCFQLDRQELAILRSQLVTSSWGGRRSLPFAFTEHGVVMLASVLNTPVAVEASLRVVKVFIRLRELLSKDRELARKFGELEARVASHDKAISSLFDAIRKLLSNGGNPEDQPKREIGFHVKNERRTQTKKTGILIKHA